MYKGRFFSICLLILLPVPVFAAPLAPLNRQVEYRFAWMGVPFGTLNLEADESGGRYRLHSHVESTFIARIFSAHKSDATASGMLTDPVENATRSFDSRYDNRDGPSSVHLEFTDGILTGREVINSEPPGKRVPVADSELTGATDFLTFVMAVRQRLNHALEANADHFTVRLFDGKRLMDTDWTVEGRQMLKLKTGERKVIRASATRQPLSGYTEKERARIARGEPPLTVYFSDDAEKLPLKLELKVGLGTVTATLVAN